VSQYQKRKDALALREILFKQLIEVEKDFWEPFRIWKNFSNHEHQKEVKSDYQREFRRTIYETFYSLLSLSYKLETHLELSDDHRNDFTKFKNHINKFNEDICNFFYVEENDETRKRIMNTHGVVLNDIDKIADIIYSAKIKLDYY